MWAAEKENDWNHYSLWGIRNKIARFQLYYVKLARAYPLCISLFDFIISHEKEWMMISVLRNIPTKISNSLLLQ